LLTGTAAAVALAAAAPAIAAPAIVTVEAARRDSLLVCTLETRGLPDARSRETIASGLPSALLLAVELLDADGDLLAATRIPVRLEPDLVAEVFLLRTPFLDLRAGTLDELAALLTRLGPLPVLPLSGIDPRRIVRLQARLAVYPLAPAEIARVHALFGTEQDAGREERQELSVGIGTLVRRLFGGDADEDWVCTQTSRAFRADTLGEAP
jgi:hypothetical protein